MSVTVPVLFELVGGFGGTDFATRAPILADYSTDGGISKLVQNSVWLYAKLNRRIVGEWGSFGHFSDGIGGRAEITTTSASYETLFEIPVKLSANTDQVRQTIHGQNIDVRVTFWGAADLTSSIDTVTTSVGATEGSQTGVSGSLGGDEDITMEVEIRHDGTSPGRLYLYMLNEAALSTSDLP